MIADFHNDILTSEKSDIIKLSTQLVCGVCALYSGSRSFSTLQQLANDFNLYRPKNLFLGLEDVSYMDEDTAETVCSWSPVYASLTWNNANALAGGCMSSTGLTLRGKKAIEILSCHNIYIDVAHLNAESFFDVLDCDTYGILDSHTCFCAVHKHPRNLFDWQIKEIIDRGGLIGITFVGKFLTDGVATVSDVFHHIDYAVQKFGIDHFCLGSDYNGTSDLPVGLSNYADFVLLKELLKKAGYKEREINKLFAQNLQKLLAKNADRGR